MESALRARAAADTTPRNSMAPWGQGPDPQMIEKTGHAYLKKKFPKVRSTLAHVSHTQQSSTTFWNGAFPGPRKARTSSRRAAT